jgi:hypothetical protein
MGKIHAYLGAGPWSEGEGFPHRIDLRVAKERPEAFLLKMLVVGQYVGQTFAPHCRCERCASMPPGAAGRSPCKSKRLAPAPRPEQRQELIDVARRREIDVVLVWRLDRWGRSLMDLVTTPQELSDLNVGFVSLTEALDLTTSTGRAMAGMLSVFAAFERDILRERVLAGLAHARQNGKQLGRPMTAGLQAAAIRKLYGAGIAKADISRQLRIGRTSVRRMLTAKDNR